jgi:hypothetical protein
MFRHPLIDARAAERLLNVTYATANSALANLLAGGLISETTGKARNRVFRFDSYLRLFEEESTAMPRIYEAPRADDYLHEGEADQQLPPG